MKKPFDLWTEGLFSEMVDGVGYEPESLPAPSAR